MLLLPFTRANAHPMPHSVLMLDIQDKGIGAELIWPLKEFQIVFPNEQLDTNVETLIQRKGAWLDAYLREHLRVIDQGGKPWTYEIRGKHVASDEQEATGRFHELIFSLWMQPPSGSSARHFTVLYDAIMHNLITHKMYVSIRQDWDGGLGKKDSNDAQLGIVTLNYKDNSIKPLIVNLDEGSRWRGFRNMVALGMEHISEGIDHLMFLLVLLLPAPLLVSGKKWGASGGTRYSIIRLLKIITAFTAGHSLTLILGASGWIKVPAQPIEILIAVSILAGAIHALRPLFPGREAFVAAGFGLIHGLAFAGTLTALHLDQVRLAISILGFNMGIELMQLFIMLVTVPWLIILSAYSIYKWVRITGGILTLLAAVAWLVERATGSSNPVSKQLEILTTHGNIFVMALALLAIGVYFISDSSKKTELTQS